MDSLLVADSFRVRGGSGRAEVRGLARHLERFRRGAGEAAAELGLPEPDTERFLASALSAIAEYGEGFPRLELHRNGRLDVRLRPLPKLGDSLDLRSVWPADAQPAGSVTRKGPNLERYLQLNRELGAEALLLDADGRVVEGTTTSVLWWSGGDLCLVRSTARVASVSEAMITEIAGRHDTALRPTAVSPAELARHEVWAVNALHGIRVVRAIDGEPTPGGVPRRLTSFREALDRTWEPVPR